MSIKMGNFFINKKFCIALFFLVNYNKKNRYLQNQKGFYSWITQIL